MSRILIFAEAVTLAHVARPIALSRVLRDLGHDVCIAAAPSAHHWLAAEGVPFWPLWSIEPSAFVRALSLGIPAYSFATLKRYVADDLSAIDAFGPDIVVGDFRLSLYISARLAKKPYGAIANAYWSRRYWRGGDAPPIAPLSWLPPAVANALFDRIHPAAFALHAMPFRLACKAFGIGALEGDIRDIYTASDGTAFADVEHFYDWRNGSGERATFIGPLAWEPPGQPGLPPLPDDRPIVFVSFGTSGQRGLLPSILDTLASMPIHCIVATGGAGNLTGGAGNLNLPANCVHAAPFVPYATACASSAAMICNGGTPATYAAVGRGKPVLGLFHNLDQALNMRIVQELGAGLASSAHARQLPQLKRSINKLLIDGELAARAAEASRDMPDAAREASGVRAWIASLSRESGSRQASKRFTNAARQEAPSTEDKS